MVTTFVVIRPASALLRLGILWGVLSVGLLAMDRVQASGVALFVALLSTGLAVVTWVLWTLGEVLVCLAGLGVLLHRAGRGVIRGVRLLASPGRALVGASCSSS